MRPNQSCLCMLVITIMMHGIFLDSIQITPGNDIHDLKNSIHCMHKVSQLNDKELTCQPKTSLEVLASSSNTFSAIIMQILFMHS